MQVQPCPNYAGCRKQIARAMCAIDAPPGILVLIEEEDGRLELLDGQHSAYLESYEPSDVRRADSEEISEKGQQALAEVSLVGVVNESGVGDYIALVSSQGPMFSPGWNHPLFTLFEKIHLRPGQKVYLSDRHGHRGSATVKAVNVVGGWSCGRAISFPEGEALSDSRRQGPLVFSRGIGDSMLRATTPDTRPLYRARRRRLDFGEGTFDYEPAGAVDFDGDGNHEMIFRESGWEGGGFSVFKHFEDGWLKVLGIGSGCSG